MRHFIFVFFLHLHNASRDRKNETGAGVAQARPVIRPIFPCRRDCYGSYSLILIFLETLIARRSLRPNTSNSPLASVHQKSKHLRHIKQAKQTLQRKQSCVQEQSFAIVTWLYHYGFIWYFFVLYFVRLYLILQFLILHLPEQLFLCRFGFFSSLGIIRGGVKLKTGGVFDKCDGFSA
jgi:hypothetical protein